MKGRAVRPLRAGDENDVFWFVGADDIITQKMAVPPPPKPMAERLISHTPFNPTLQCRVQGKLSAPACMGDYCHLERQQGAKKSGRRRRRSQPGIDADPAVGHLAAVAGGGGSLGDLVVTQDGAVVALSDLVSRAPSASRPSRPRLIRRPLVATRLHRRRRRSESAGCCPASPSTPTPTTRTRWARRAARRRARARWALG